MKEYLVFTDNNEHSYNIVVKGSDDGIKTYTLYSSNNVIWNDSHKNKLLVRIIQNDLEYKISNPEELNDVSSMLELRILLNFIDRDNDHKVKIIPNNVVANFK